MKTKKLSTKQLTVLGLMIAVLVLMSYTPLGYLNIGPLAITFNMIPVAIAAISCGPLGGAVLGAVFGLTSFGQCIGIGGVSAMGATLFSISPVLAFIQRFVPRFLDGWLLGYLFRWLRKATKNTTLAGYITGFLSDYLYQFCDAHAAKMYLCQPAAPVWEIYGRQYAFSILQPWL